MENKDSDELSTVTSQVLDYYQRYSQNHNFSSYLRGTIPHITDRGEETTSTYTITEPTRSQEVPPLLLTEDNNENDINLGNVIGDQGRFSSPTSSVTSNRKLEWDNLADIGYGNCPKQKNLQKSLSLPLLSTLEKIQLGQRKLRVSSDENVPDQESQPDPNVKYSSLDSGSSDSYKEVGKVPYYISSTSTSSLKTKSTVIDSTSTFSSLSKLVTATTETEFTDAECTLVGKNIRSSIETCIGHPMAESTPNNIKEKDSPDSAREIKDSIESRSDSDKIILISPAYKDEICDTKSESWSSANNNLSELRCIAKCVRSNVKHLTVTKPLAVECCDYKQISNKDIQTSTLNIKTNSIAIQTDEYIETDDHIVENKIYPVYDDKRTIEFVTHDSPEESNVRSLGTNTDSDLRASQCNSFEYLYGQDLSDGSKIQLSNTTTMSSHLSGDKNAPEKIKMKRSEIEETINSASSELSSKNNPLAELISTKLSNHMINDVEKSISILQKLIKSKKYDQVTKEYYVKKIVQKIINFNYNSESSVNSDVHSQTTGDIQNSIQKICRQNNAYAENVQFHEAVPQMPTKQGFNRKGTAAKRKKLQVKTFSTNILPEDTVVDNEKTKHFLKLKDARFTITNSYDKCKTSGETSLIGDTHPENTLSPRSSPQSQVETSNSSDQSKSFRNWKENITKSEKLLEDKLGRMNSGDATSNDSELLNFAKKERQNQINWINNEINHLNKLKTLLQKKKKVRKADVKALTDLQVDQIPASNKTTSVYVITTEKESLSSNNTNTSSDQLSWNNLRKKCNCLHTKYGGLPCNPSNCPILNPALEKSFRMEDSQQAFKKDIKSLPFLRNCPGLPCEIDIENAKLIASEVYPGQTPNSCVRRYVFEMPIDTDASKLGATEKRNIASIPCLSKLPNCNIKTDTQNAKLIASEICEGPLPNTCVRRYVFEIPVYDDGLNRTQSIASSSKLNKQSTSITQRRFRSSRESTRLNQQTLITKPGKCSATSVLKPCECENEKIPADQEKYCTTPSSDLLYMREVQGDKRIEICPNDKSNKTPVKVIEASVLADPGRQYQFSIQQTDAKQCIPPTCPNIHFHENRSTKRDDSFRSDDASNAGQRKVKERIREGASGLKDLNDRIPSSSAHDIRTSSDDIQKSIHVSTGHKRLHHKHKDVYDPTSGQYSKEGSLRYEPHNVQANVDNGEHIKQTQRYEDEKILFSRTQNVRPGSPRSSQYQTSDGYPKEDGLRYKPHTVHTSADDGHPKQTDRYDDKNRLFSRTENVRIDGSDKSAQKFLQHQTSDEYHKEDRLRYKPQTVHASVDDEGHPNQTDRYDDKNRLFSKRANAGIENGDKSAPKSSQHQTSDEYYKKNGLRYKSENVHTSADDEEHPNQADRYDDKNRPFSKTVNVRIETGDKSAPKSSHHQTSDEYYKEDVHTSKQTDRYDDKNRGLKSSQYQTSDEYPKDDRLRHKPHTVHTTADAGGHPKQTDRYDDKNRLFSRTENDRIDSSDKSAQKFSQHQTSDEYHKEDRLRYKPQTVHASVDDGGHPKQTQRYDDENIYFSRTQNVRTSSDDKSTPKYSQYQTSDEYPKEDGLRYRPRNVYTNVTDAGHYKHAQKYDGKDTFRSRTQNAYGSSDDRSAPKSSQYQASSEKKLPTNSASDNQNSKYVHGEIMQDISIRDDYRTQSRLGVGSDEKINDPRVSSKFTPHSGMSVKDAGSQKEIFHMKASITSPREINRIGVTGGKEPLNKGSRYKSKPDHAITRAGRIKHNERQSDSRRSEDNNQKLQMRKSKDNDKRSESSSDYDADSSDYSGSSDSTDDIPRICLCCNTAEAKFRSKLHGLPNQIRNALCDPCYMRNQTNWGGQKPYYTYPGHVCNCYSVIKTETVRDIQRTVEELENLERERDCCSCSYGCKMQRYRDRHGKHRKSVAYTLTFEDVEKTASEDTLNGHTKKAPLEEIRVKIPRFVKKSHKDRENKRKSKREKHSKHRRNARRSKPLTLQDHLFANRPNFIVNAEERRKAFIELAYMREERCQKYKQLLAMSNGIIPESNFNNKPSTELRMFTSKEMKGITAKNYKKLPEVQKKLEENRNKQIKKANKMLSDIFNKKLRERVLKGKPAVSMSTSVIKLP